MRKRFEKIEGVSARQGELVQDLMGLADKQDPMADEALASLASGDFHSNMEVLRHAISSGDISALPDPAGRLVSHSFSLVEGVSWDRVDEGARAYLSLGFKPLMTALGLGSLLNTYLSGAFVRQLTDAGDLLRMAPRRLIETGGWLGACLQQDGLRGGRMGFATTIHVRLTHAKVRRAFNSGDRWDHQRWGVPLSQFDQLHGLLVFSYVAIRSLERVGHRLSEDQLNAAYNMWRLIGGLLGVSHSHLVKSHAECAELLNLIEQLNGPTSPEASKPLTDALLGVYYDQTSERIPKLFMPWAHNVINALPYRFLGHVQASSLGVPEPSPMGASFVALRLGMRRHFQSTSTFSRRAERSRQEFGSYVAEHFGSADAGPTARALEADG